MSASQRLAWGRRGAVKQPKRSEAKPIREVAFGYPIEPASTRSPQRSESANQSPIPDSRTRHPTPDKVRSATPLSRWASSQPVCTHPSRQASHPLQGCKTIAAHSQEERLSSLLLPVRPLTRARALGLGVAPLAVQERALKGANVLKKSLLLRGCGHQPLLCV
eukprot:9267192-Pyramimonas_sp.AAC.1